MQKDHPREGLITFLDLQTLLTSVPVDEAIEFMLDMVYKSEHDQHPRGRLRETPADLH